MRRGRVEHDPPVRHPPGTREARFAGDPGGDHDEHREQYA